MGFVFEVMNFEFLLCFNKVKKRGVLWSVPSFFLDEKGITDYVINLRFPSIFHKLRLLLELEN